MPDPEDVPEPADFVAQVPRIELAILATRAKQEDPGWLEVKLRLRNGTSHAITAHRLARWSRNVGWYADKDGMADDAVRFDEQSASKVIAPGQSAELVLSVLRKRASEGSPHVARELKLELNYRGEDGRGAQVLSNTVETDPGPEGHSRGCLGALLLLLLP